VAKTVSSRCHVLILEAVFYFWGQGYGRWTFVKATRSLGRGGEFPSRHNLLFTGGPLVAKTVSSRCPVLILEAVFYFWGQGYGRWTFVKATRSLGRGGEFPSRHNLLFTGGPLVATTVSSRCPVLILEAVFYFWGQGYGRWTFVKATRSLGRGGGVPLPS
jgi:hypothetical protein